ncbi:hypothetical protein BBP40_005497 [Aspergillus hancockii]|nr:hypothetical protein BBP40_005497 [Aspergillus hancockii]
MDREYATRMTTGFAFWERRFTTPRMSVVRTFRRLCRRVRRHGLGRLALSFCILVAAIVLCLYLLLAYHLANDPRLVPSAFRQARSVLLVTAHPDDETLFFSPSITYRRGDPNVHRSLLVISSGNYAGLGETRQKELHNSCEQLDISQDRCVVLDHADLQDNPRKWWDEDLVKELVSSYVQKWNVDLILTFDHGGISGHVNHRSVSAGVRKYVHATPQAPHTYKLQSVSLLRKYTSLLDLMPTSFQFLGRILKALLTTPLSRTQVEQRAIHDTTPLEEYNDKALLVCSWQAYRVSRAAFSQHSSQYSWDRVLYLVLSRYMWFNNLELVA